MTSPENGDVPPVTDETVELDVPNPPGSIRHVQNPVEHYVVAAVCGAFGTATGSASALAVANAEQLGNGGVPLVVAFGGTATAVALHAAAKELRTGWRRQRLEADSQQ